MADTAVTAPPSGVAEKATDPVMVHVSLTRVTRTLTAVVVLLVGLYGVLGLLQAVLDLDAFPVAVLDLDGELQVGAWFSTALLLVGALMLALTASVATARGDSDGRWWRFLSAGFVVMSLEEAVDLHQRISEPLSRLLDLDGGALRAAWVIPAALGIVVLGACMVPFIRRMPSPLRRRLLLAAALFVGGAVGLEIVGQALFVTSGAGVVSGAVNLVEETLEPAAVILLIHTLGRHLAELTGTAGLRLTLGDGGGSPAADARR